MKKLASTITILVAALSLAATGHAGPWGRGPGPGPAAPVNVESLKSFQQETSALRDQMQLKKAELHNAYQANPVDEAKVQALWTEIDQLRAQIATIADTYQIPATGCRQGGGRYAMHTYRR